MASFSSNFKFLHNIDFVYSRFLVFVIVNCSVFLNGSNLGMIGMIHWFENGYHTMVRVVEQIKPSSWGWRSGWCRWITNRPSSMITILIQSATDFLPCRREIIKETVHVAVAVADMDIDCHLYIVFGNRYQKYSTNCWWISGMVSRTKSHQLGKIVHGYLAASSDVDVTHAHDEEPASSSLSSSSSKEPNVNAPSCLF